MSSAHSVDVQHFVGANDNNTPPSPVATAALARGDETVRVVSKFGHSCCWASTWQDILHESRQSC